RADEMCSASHPISDETARSGWAVLQISRWASGSDADDGAGQGAGDARDGLDLRHHEGAELVDGGALGADDDVVRTGDVLGLLDPGDLGDCGGDLGGLADLGLHEDVGVNGHGWSFRSGHDTL